MIWITIVDTVTCASGAPASYISSFKSKILNTPARSNCNIIAEDLGYTTPEVEKLLSDSGLPGMRILEFGFNPDCESVHDPNNCIFNSVCYIGTHDNETVNGWVKSRTGHGCIPYAKEYMHITVDEGWCWGMIRTGMSTASRLFVLQMQDALELPGSTRMNTPGTILGNWQWRMLPDACDRDLAQKLLHYTKIYHRV